MAAMARPICLTFGCAVYMPRQTLFQHFEDTSLAEEGKEQGRNTEGTLEDHVGTGIISVVKPFHETLQANEKIE